ncbi:glycosyl transferase [Novosphingobium resinovorum]|uniref:Glycosyl transferase n=1 Tax=Novosphingobium resinovorum TaxID=158500 RepID=A0A1D8A9A0_9SPHN|nr:glycosyl transferase [Novosphingobium resinovorum]
MTCVILTYNEETHIERAIASVRGVADDILVIDSFSTDRTVTLAQAAGARVLQHAFVNHAAQFNWGLDNGDIRTSWIFRLDADEYIGADLASRMRDELAAMPSDVAGVLLSRRHIWMGRWVRHGGRYPLHMLRIWRNGQGRVENRWMDEHVIVEGGRTVHMQGEFADACERDITFFVTKHNGYATREAFEVLNTNYGLITLGAEDSDKLSRQAKMKRFIKKNIYSRIPFGIGPIFYFLFRYIVQLGFLDGRSGFIYHFMQGLWYRLLVESKVYEFELSLKDCPDNAARIARLQDLTGLRFMA